MKIRKAVLGVWVLAGLIAVAGCSGSGGSKRACEVFSPATVTVPTSQNDQRVATNATGVPSEAGNKTQNCE